MYKSVVRLIFSSNYWINSTFSKLSWVLLITGLSSYITECCVTSGAMGIRIWRLQTPDGDSVVRVVKTRRSPVNATFTMRSEKPGMNKNVLSRNSLAWVFSQQTFDQTFSSGTEIVWQSELSSPDLSKQTTVFSTMKGISATKAQLQIWFNKIFRYILPSHQHGVEHHPQAPHVRWPARVLGVGPENLRRHVGRTPVLVR